jgi:predicted HicB family RNase H-like nuclease
MPSPHQTEQPSNRPDREDKRPLTIWVDEPMHRQIKVKAAKRGVSIKKAVSDVLAEWLKEPSEDRPA